MNRFFPPNFSNLVKFHSVFQKHHTKLVTYTCSFTIDSTQLTIETTDSLKPRVPKESLDFGSVLTDHMLEIDWHKKTGWAAPVIRKYRNLEISPAASCLQYAVACFEGMKVFKDSQGNLRLFRPDKNLERFKFSMNRLGMPELDTAGFFQCLKALLKLEKDWIPEGDGYSMYIRPTAIGTHPFLGVGPSDSIKLYTVLSPVAPLFKKAMKLFAETENVRAWPNGVGNAKVAANYGPTIKPQTLAAQKGYSQVLWLFGEDHTVTEGGAMNIFFLIKNKDGDKELITAPLTRGDILPGVTRDSVLELTRGWGEFKVEERFITMPEVKKCSEEGRLCEVFLSGTAAIVAPVKAIHYLGSDIEVPTGETMGPITQKNSE